jgi:hypothetical protein
VPTNSPVSLTALNIHPLKSHLSRSPPHKQGIGHIGTVHPSRPCPPIASNPTDPSLLHRGALQTKCIRLSELRNEILRSEAEGNRKSAQKGKLLRLRQFPQKLERLRLERSLGFRILQRPGEIGSLEKDQIETETFS